MKQRTRTQKKTHQQIALDLDPAFVRPLREAQNEFLQVLLTDFSVHRRQRAMHLTAKFDMDTPAVWRRAGKREILEALDARAIVRYQKAFEALLLLGKKPSLQFSDSRFPMRYGNAGTLPVIQRGGHDYYCLFFRDQHPVGWNIANGGAESLAELLDPSLNLIRELREELIVMEPASGRRYVFADEEGRLPDHPDFALARRIWTAIFQKRKGHRATNFSQLEEITLPLKWLHGPDAITIQFQDREPLLVGGFYLNLNAEDFSIELDRVAKLEIGPDAVLCDGEVVNGRLLNRVVGLFRVDRFNAELAAGRERFLPDCVFYSGEEYPGRQVSTVVARYLRDLRRSGVYEDHASDAYREAEEPFALCPVTRTLVKRVLLHLGETSRGLQFTSSADSACRVFVSFGSEDRALARKVFRFLDRRGKGVFFSDEAERIGQADFANAIDRALDQAQAMVVVGGHPDRFHKPWVRYEWQSFHNDILSGRKPWNTPLLAFVAGVQPEALPRPLSFRQVFSCDPDHPEPTLRQLQTLLP